jgi:glycosyltransferase involved in cell wall biosynthesis
MPDWEASKENEILITIIIASFNAGLHLADCLGSIREHAFKNTEILVMDGGSSDNTISILRSFNHPNLSWISNPDKGIYDALNKGVKLAKGKWIHFLGADDRLLPGFKELASKLEDENTIYYADSEDYYGDRENVFPLLKGPFTKYRLAKFCMNHQSIIYPAKAFRKYHYDLKYKVAADYVLNMALWGDDDFRKIFFPLRIVRYDMTGFSSFTTDELFKKDKPLLVKRYLGWWISLRYRFKKFKENRKNNYNI